MLKWSSGGVTDFGTVRKLNEDAFLDKPESGLWVVADGMGGHDAGEYASAMIVDVLSEIAPDPDFEDTVKLISEQMNSVNSTLLEETKKRDLTMIGSTVVVMLAGEDQFACMWAGDSRLYRIRQGELKQISRDHSEVQELVDQGKIAKEDAEKHPSANVITRAIGAIDTLKLDKVFGDLLAGDKFLLCSDGLYRDISEQEIAESLHTNGEPTQIAQNLLQLALDRGARDNVTALAIDISHSD